MSDPRTPSSDHTPSAAEALDREEERVGDIPRGPNDTPENRKRLQELEADGPRRRARIRSVGIDLNNLGGEGYFPHSGPFERRRHAAL